MIYVVTLVSFMIVIWIIIYLLFLLPDGRSKFHYNSGLTETELESLFKLYYDVWKVDRVRIKTYHDNYENYKTSLFYVYLDFYLLIHILNKEDRNNVLLDIKNGIIRKHYIQTQSKHRDYELRFPKSEIDEAIYLLFVSERLTQEQFYELLKL